MVCVPSRELRLTLNFLMGNYLHVWGWGCPVAGTHLPPPCFYFYTPEVENQLSESLANRAKTIFMRHRRPGAPVTPQASALKISS